MEILRKNIKSVGRGNKISIFFLGDIHEGSANHAEESFKYAIKTIKETPNSYVIGMGDYVDAINHRDPRFNPAEIDPEYAIKDLKDLPNIQVQRVCRKLEPIKDKIIGLLYGNHEESLIKYSTFDPVKQIVKTLGIDIPKIGYTGIVAINIYRGSRKTISLQYIIDLNHGIGGTGKREGYKVNIVHDVFRWTSGDCRVMAHIHQMSSDLQDFSYLNLHKYQLNYRKVWFGSTGCFMHKQKQGTRGYFESKAGPHSDLGMLRYEITIGEDKTKSRTSLDKIYC